MTEAIASTATPTGATTQTDADARDPVAATQTTTSPAPSANPAPPADGAKEPATPEITGEAAPLAAWDMFETAIADHTFGLALDAEAAEQQARDHVSRGHGFETAVALRALAAEARQRTRDGGEIGTALQNVGMGTAAAYLDTVADQISAISGFELFEVIESADEIEGAADLVTSARRYTAGQFDILITEHLAPALAVEIPQAPPSLASAPLPLDLQAKDLRSAGLLSIALRRQLDEVRRVDPANLPVLRGLALTVRVIEETRRGEAFPATRFARIAVGTDPRPLHTAVRLRQIASLVDAHFPNRTVQKTQLGAHDGLSLAGKLEAMASEIERTASDPALRAQALIAGAFIEVNQDVTAAQEAAVAQASAEPVNAQEQSAVPGSLAAFRAGLGSDVSLEAALLGSLLNAPSAIGQIEKLLGARDFADPEMRVVYDALRSLHSSRGLYDSAAMTTEKGRFRAAEENRLKLVEALQTSLVPHSLSQRDIQRLVSEIHAAAPEASLPFRGVFEPAAQFDLARRVCERGIERRMNAMAVQMDRGTPLVTPARLIPDRSARSARKLAANLESIDAQLDKMAAQLANAVWRTGADAAGEQAAAAVVETSRRWRMPDPLRPVLAPMRHRAERHILHLALHAGHMEEIPQAILDLQPEHFGSERHANLWRTIKDVQSRGLPVNWVVVREEVRAQDFTHHPMPSAKDLAKLGMPPEVSHDKVRRSLGMLVSSALARAKSDVKNALVALADSSKVPTAAGVATARSQVKQLRAHATTASDQLRQIDAIGAGNRPPPARPYPGEPLIRVGGHRP